MKKIIKWIAALLVKNAPLIGKYVRPLLEAVADRPDLYDMASHAVLDVADDASLNGSTGDTKHLAALSLLKQSVAAAGIAAGTAILHQLVAQAFTKLTEEGTLGGASK